MKWYKTLVPRETGFGGAADGKPVFRGVEFTFFSLTGPPANILPNPILLSESG